MKGYVADIETLTTSNKTFRTVLYTGRNCQLVLMSLLPREEIGEEIHAENDQFFRFESGHGTVVIDGVLHDVTDGAAVIIPAGAKHNVINVSDTEPLKMYTIYSPPHHKDGTIHATKAKAEAHDEEYDGVPTE